MGDRPASAKAAEPHAGNGAAPRAPAQDPSVPAWARDVELGLRLPAGDAGAAGAGGAAGPLGVLVDDGAPGPGQVTREAFMARLEARIRAVADAELAPAGKTARDCPYLERWLAFYRTRPAATVERAVRLYAVGVLPSAEGMVEAVEGRVRDSVRRWRDTGAVTGIPAESPLSGAGAGADAGGTAGARVAGLELGPGAPLDPAVRAAAEAGLGQPLGDVRVHTDARAGRLAGERGARAFTVGQDVVFGPGEYRPGTLAGDALAAHELAHTVQQRGAAPIAQAFTEAPGPPLEAAAHRAAARVLLHAPAHRSRVEGWAGGMGGAGQEALAGIRAHAAVTPGSAGGLRLQRCPSKANLDDLGLQAPEYQESGPAALDPLFDPSTSPGVWPVATQGAAGERVFLLDGDGDQSAELRATIRLEGQAVVVALTQLSSAQTLSFTFGLAGLPPVTLAPRVLHLTDGRGPTRIALDAGLTLVLELRPPDPDAAQTVYTATVRGPKVDRSATYTFAKETRLLNPVFQAANPQALGGKWTMDVLVGAYADPFRLTFVHGWLDRVQVTASPLVDGNPAGGQTAEVRGLFGPLAVKVLRAGSRLVLDLDGDGAADLTLYDRLTPQSTGGAALAPRDARLNRDHSLRGVTAGGEVDLGLFQVQDGKLLPATPAAVVGLPSDRLKAIVGAGGFDRVRSGMLQKAVADGRVRWELAAAWDDAAAATDGVRKAWARSQSGDATEAAEGKKALAGALPVQDAAITRYQARLTADAGGEGNIDWPAQLENEKITGTNPYTGEEFDKPTYRWQSIESTKAPTLTRLLAALRKSQVAEELALWDAAATELDRWVASQLTAGSLEGEFTAAATAAAVEALGSQQGATDFAVVFRSVEDQRQALRDKAAAAGLVDAALIAAWTDFSGDWAVLQASIGAMRAKPGAISDQARKDGTATFGQLWPVVLAKGKKFRDLYLDQAGGQGRAEGEFNGPDDSLSGYDNVYTGEHWDLNWRKVAKLDRRADISTLVDALTVQQWDVAAATYALAANRLDSWVASRLAAGSDKDKQAGQRLPQLVKLSGELEKTARDAGAQRPRPVNAIFFPQEDYVKSLRLTQMPLVLFTYHDADKWYLKDVTNPDNVFTDRVDYDAKDGDVPPERLFAKLNDADHFPKGYVHYKLPDEYDAKGALLRAGRVGAVQTTSPTSPAQWLGYASAALGAAALVLATGGVGGIWVTACVIGASATGVASAGLDIYEKQQQGRLDRSTVFVDVVQIVANVAGGAGTVAREVYLAKEAVLAVAAGGAGELSPASVWLAKNWGGLARLYKPIQIVGAAADTVSFLAYTSAAASELEGIMSGPGTEADRLRAGALLLARFAATGALTVLTVRSLGELPAKSRVELGFGRDGRPILRVPENTYTPGHYREGLEKALQKAGHELKDVEVKVLPAKDFDALHADGDALVTVSGGKVVVQVRNGALLGAAEEEALHVVQARNPALKPLFEALDQKLLKDWPKLTPKQKVAAVRAKLELELDTQHAVIAEIKAKSYVSDLDQVRADQAREHIENLRGQYAELADVEADFLAKGETKGSKLFDEPPGLYARRTATRRPYDKRWTNLTLKQFKQQYRSRYPDTSLTDQELEDYFLIEGKRLNPATGRLKAPDADEDVTPGYEARYKNFEGQERLVLSSEQTPGAGTEKVTFEEDLAKRRQAALDRRDKAIQERDDLLSGKKKPPAGETAEGAAAKVGARVNDASRELGEVWTEAFMAQHFPGYTRVYPPKGAPSRSGDFDEIWEGTTQNTRGKFVVQQVVIEAKGGGATLGSRKLTQSTIRAQQGNRAYFDDIVKNMLASGDTAVSDAALRLQQTGMKNTRYVLVKGTVSIEGGKSVSNVGVVREFDLSPQP